MHDAEALISEGHAINTLSRGSIISNYIAPVDPEVFYCSEKSGIFIAEIKRAASWRYRSCGRWRWRDCWDYCSSGEHSTGSYSCILLIFRILTDLLICRVAQFHKVLDCFRHYIAKEVKLNDSICWIHSFLNEFYFHPY